MYLHVQEEITVYWTFFGEKLFLFEIIDSKLNKCYFVWLKLGGIIDFKVF
jgi:hypothetical protein